MASVQNGHISYKLYYSKRRQEKTFHLTSLSNKRLVIYQDKYFFCIKIPNTKRQKKFKSTKDCNGDLDLPWMNYGTKMQGSREIESKIQRKFLLSVHPLLFKSLDTRWESISTWDLVHSSHSVSSTSMQQTIPAYCVHWPLQIPMIILADVKYERWASKY